MVLINEKASTFGLHPSLIIPVGAKSRESIEAFVGPILQVFGREEAYLVTFEPHGLSNGLPVWKLERSHLLNNSLQLWVDVDMRKYRGLYMDIFNNLMKEKGMVVDHIMNRKLARALVHVSRGTNSSSGRGGETLAVDFLGLSASLNPEINSAEIVYADPADLLKMLDVNVGGFALDAVRDRHYLLYG
jgi:hypothetical protein